MQILSPQQDQQQAVGIMGGMFDPVHTGHLRAAIEFAEFFSLSCVRLLPCHQPPHRDQAQVSSKQRVAMLQLAIREMKNFTVDDRELAYEEPSYTVRSLRQIRKELGDTTPIYFALGADAFNAIESWKDWQELFSLANFVVMHRPTTKISLANTIIESKLQTFTGRHQAAGNIYELTITALDISSTNIRQMIQSESSIKFLLPEVVEQYIYQHQLYR